MLNISSASTILASASFLAPDPVDALPPAQRAAARRTGKRSDGLPPHWVLAHHHGDFEQRRAYAPLFAQAEHSGWIRDRELEAGAFAEHIVDGRVRALLLDGAQGDEALATIIYTVRHDLASRLPIFVVLPAPDPQRTARLLLAGADEVTVAYLDHSLFEARLAVIARLDRLAFDRVSGDNFGAYAFDSRRNIVSIGDERIKLTPTQFRIALYFFRNLDQTLPFWKMIGELWHEPQPNIADSIRVHVCRIRQKLRLDGSHGYALSRYNRGGYRLSPSEGTGIAVEKKVA